MLRRLWSSKPTLQSASVVAGAVTDPATDAEISQAHEDLKREYAPRYVAHWQHFESANVADLAPKARELWHNGFLRMDAALTKAEVSDAIGELRSTGGVFSGDDTGPIPYASLRKDGIAALEVADQTPICLGDRRATMCFRWPERSMATG